MAYRAPITKSRISFNLPPPQLMPPSKILPRRKSIRAIFEPLHRNFMDNRKNSMGQGLMSKRSFTSGSMKKYRLNKAKPSIHILKNKRQSKYNIMNIKGLGSKSKGNLAMKTAFSRPQMRSEKSKSYQHVMPDPPLNWNQFASTISKRIESAWNKDVEDVRTKPYLPSQDQPINQQYSNPAQPMTTDYSKFVYRKAPPNMIAPTVENPSTTTRKPSFLGSNSILKAPRPEKTRTFLNSQNKDQEFRALYDRLRAHYMLQEETYKNMAVSEKLPLIIQNLVQFERQLMEYMDGPNPHPEAKVVLKDLRSRRAETMSRKDSYIGLAASPGGRGRMPDVATITNPDSLLHTFPTPKNQSQGSFRNVLETFNTELVSRKSDLNTLNQCTKLLEKQQLERDQTSTSNKSNARKSLKKLLNKSNPNKRLVEIPELVPKKKDAVEGVVEIHKRLEKLAAYMQEQAPVRTLQCKMPNGAQISSTEALQNKLQNVTTKENESPQKKIKWNRSDFTRLLPHAGEIPKNASKVVNDDKTARGFKNESKELSSKTYMGWLEELMSQKLGQDLSGSSNPPPGNSIKDKQKGLLPKWATIATKKEEDPVTKFKRTYEGFQKYALAVQNKNKTRENMVNNNEQAIRLLNQPTTFLTKQEGVPHEYNFSKDLENVTNTIRAIIANSKNRSIPETKAPTPVPNQKPLGIRFQETTPPPASNVSTTKKIPKLVFMQNSMDINTLMNPKALDQQPKESQTVVSPATANNFRAIDGFSNFRPGIITPLNLKKNIEPQTNNLVRRASSKTQTIYTAANTVNRPVMRSFLERKFGERQRVDSKFGVNLQIPKIKPPWYSGLDHKPVRVGALPQSVEARFRHFRDPSPVQQRMSLSLPKYAPISDPSAAPQYLANPREKPMNVYSALSAEIKKW